MHNDFSALTRSSQPVLEGIRSWFASDLGRHVLKNESAMLEQLLPGLFGYHLVQFSVQDGVLHDASPIQNKVVVNLDTTKAGLVSKPTQLPFSNDSIDVALLHHVLDFAESPQKILREMSRATLPMGHIVIVGFNPMSLWGAWRTIVHTTHYKGIAPWNGAFIRPGRLMDWLNLLDFKIDRAQYSIYRPPVSRYLGEVNDYSHGVSRTLNLPIGAVYVIVARKHVGAVRSIKSVWSRHQPFGRLSAVRSVKHDGMTTVEHHSGQDKY
jgi:SAM-dependent methyltransferase